MTIPVPARLPLLALGILCLITGLWGALGRLGFSFPPPQPDLVAFHGPLMVSGFLGTLVSLERAVGLGRRWAFLAPLATGIGGLSLALAPGPASGVALTIGAVGLLAIMLVAFRIQPSWASATIAAGAACWAMGNARFATGVPVPQVVPWWTAFLVLTIAGERRELARFLALSRVDRSTFALACVAVIAGASLGVIHLDAGTRVLGAGLVALALWLCLRDMARVSIRREGLTRFIGVCLLTGYAWLAVGGVLSIAYGAVAAGPAYDATLHAIFLGFVMAMIFGHAPIIFPALLERPIPFRTAFYAHLVLLHATLALRIAGDVCGAPAAVQWGGLGNAAAIVLFFGNTLTSLIRGQRAMRGG